MYWFHNRTNRFSDLATEKEEQSQKLTPIAPSSSKFNPKDTKKTSKRHQQLMSFWCLFRLNFEDEGATRPCARLPITKPITQKCKECQPGQDTIIFIHCALPSCSRTLSALDRRFLVPPVRRL